MAWHIRREVTSDTGSSRYHGPKDRDADGDALLLFKHDMDEGVPWLRLGFGLGGWRVSRNTVR